MTDFLTAALHKREMNGNKRRLRIDAGLIDFASNDYLGLARSPLMHHAVLSAWNGLGSTGSRLLTGNTAFAEELEQTIAQYHRQQAALLFHCGYLANVGLLSAVMKRQDVVFYDAQLHASMRDGMRLSGATTYPFEHNDLEHLERRLQRATGIAKRFVCIESVYSIDGSLAPLREMAALCQRYDAMLIVDEAHAVGVLGPEGRGLVVAQDLTHKVFAVVVTFGKALGVFGAAVLGSHALRDYLINFSRPCIYSTALPIHALTAIRCAYTLLPTLNAERDQLLQRIAQLRQVQLTPSSTAIHALEITGNARVKSVARYLSQQGYATNPILSPTVQQKHECLRLSLHAFNTKEELDGLLTLITQIK